MGTKDQERVREQEIELRPAVGNDHTAVTDVAAHRAEQGPDGGEVIVFRAQAIEVCPVQGVHQVDDQPGEAALIAPYRTVEPPQVEAGKRLAGVNRIAACPELRYRSGGYFLSFLPSNSE